MTETELYLLIAHVVFTWGMTGVVWVVQVVSYPAFNMVDPDDFRRYHAFYTRRIGWIVVPLMTGELATGAILLILDPAVVAAQGLKVLLGINLAVLAGTWISTFLIQVPIHRSLSLGKNDVKIRALVRTNWIRTLAWTFRALLLAAVVLTITGI